MSSVRLGLFVLLSFLFSISTMAQSRSWASNEFVEEAQDFHNRAIEAAIWGMPIVAMDAMRQAYFRDAKAKYNDVVLLAKDWRNQVTTPNSSSTYLYFNFNTSNGPIVVEIPAAEGGGVFGSLNDAWQAPMEDFGPQGADEGKGGKYLILPPGYKGQTPSGYIKVQAQTFNGYSVIRAIPLSNSAEDSKKVMDLAQKLKVYPLSQAANPAKTKFIDMRTKLFNGIAKMDESFYVTLGKLMNEEPLLPQDIEVMNSMKKIGLEKGRKFSFKGNTEAFRSAIMDVHKRFKDHLQNDTVAWSKNSRWSTSKAAIVGAKTGFTFKTGDVVDYKSRAETYYLACATPKKLGQASVYLGSYRDGDGAWFNGDNNYRLHVPANVPASQFWSVNVYDLDTAGFFLNAPKVGLDSYSDKMVKNHDGSVDIYFGTTAPPGKEENWIYTPAGKTWFTFFRFYGPGRGVQEKTWILPNIEKISDLKQAQQ